jgi:hypothetical protein
LSDFAEHHVQQEIAVERLVAVLADDFKSVSHDQIEHAVRDAFKLRSAAHLKEFVPVFVERDLRRTLKSSAK